MLEKWFDYIKKEDRI